MSETNNFLKFIKKENSAMLKICRILEPFSSEQKKRIIKAVMILMEPYSDTSPPPNE